jgi:glycosyltransferase involved in cell wall biosynthesis
MFPNRMNPYDGNFVENHIVATSMFSEAFVLSVHEDPNIKNAEFHLESNAKNQITTLKIYHSKKQWKSTMLLSRMYFYYKGFKRLNKLSGSFSFIHAHGFLFAGIFALLLNRLMHLPYIVTEHSTRYVSGRISFFERKFLKAAAFKARYILPVSDSLEAAMKKMGMTGNYRIVPNVIDTEVFKPQIKKSDQELKTILHISTLEDSRKNIRGLLMAIKKLSESRQDFKLRIIGESNIQRTYDLMQEIGIDKSLVHLESAKPKKEIAEQMRQADFFLLFSRVETFSVVLAEAWSSGIPVVYSKCGGLTDIDDPGLGIQVVKDNVNELSKALDVMLDRYTEFDRDYIRGFAVQNFDTQKVGDQLMNIYSKLSLQLS